MRPGTPDSVGVADAATHMRAARFCLSPAGTTSCLRAPKLLPPQISSRTNRKSSLLNSLSSANEERVSGKVQTGGAAFALDPGPHAPTKCLPRLQGHRLPFILTPGKPCFLLAIFSHRACQLLPRALHLHRPASRSGRTPHAFSVMVMVMVMVMPAVPQTDWPVRAPGCSD
jgi:hypothetical protein